MRKFFYLVITLFLFITSLNGKTFSDDDYLQIVSKNLEIKDDIVLANGDVLVYSPDYYITANRLIYDKVNGTLELFDDVSIIKENKEIVYSQYVFMNKKEDVNNFKPILLFENTEKIWFNSEDANSKSDLYDLKDSTLSSCDCDDPDWSIGFTSGDHNTTDKWINTYNTTLYIQDIPVLYTPYYGFSTDKTRRTGLLRPTIGWSSKEGFLYAQPLFIAPASNYDFEYIPSIKTLRGHGNELVFRYADSAYSMLKIEAGYFKEKSKYQEAYSLKNDKHYGWNLEYDRTKLFSNEESTDGLLIKLNSMNDVDYINTKYSNNSMDYKDRYLESKINYYYNTNNYFAGLDLKYYDDITLDNNNETLQSIPLINIHKYSNNLFFNKLSYSTDFKFSRKTRDDGVSANSTDINIPITYHTTFLDDYLNLLLSEQIYFTNIKYSNSDTYEFKDANYGRNSHVISLYTDLLKEYNSYLHTLKLSTTYTYANEFLQKGDIYGISNDDTEIDDFAITQTNRNLSIGFDQSFYNKETLSQIINHRIKQAFIYNTINGNYEKSDLENDLTYFYDYGSLSNRILFNHDLNKIISSSSNFKFTNEGYFFNVYHTYTKDTTTLENQKSITYELGMGFNKYYKASYREEFDLTADISKKREYVFNINKKCWALNLKLIDSLVATNTTDNSVLRQNIFYVQLNLKQLFVLDQEYKFEERSQ
ncbi:MAG: LPS-assembly protein LptD [Campylobacterota bacterium]|nr:LPS-assembly protein LptD [Campylobacterota bacterium]